jgi:Flp pilus assembly protein TadG
MRRPLKSFEQSIPLSRWVKDQRGVSALEFALIMPIIIVLIFGMANISQALMAQRRVNHIASAMGDLTAQNLTMMDSDFTDMFSVAAFMMKPLDQSDLSIRITSVIVDGKKIPHVDWSVAGPTLQPGLTHGAQVTTLPAGLISNTGDSVVMAETTYTFDAPVKALMPNGIKFKEVYYFRPRKSSCVLYKTPDNQAETVCPTTF